MTTTTGLAAVAAAADPVSKSAHEAAVAAARAEGLAAGKAEGLTEGAASGAAAERARLAGIEAVALPGHDKLIADCKADPSVTPDMAAGRILAAEKKLRDDQMAGIRAVEDQTGKVAADPASQRRDAAAGVAPKPGEQKSAEAYKADFAASAELQREFASADSYANYAAGVASGRIRILNKAG